jgi:hypothetical protein
MRIVVVGFRAMVSGFPNMRLNCSARFFGEGGRRFLTISPPRLTDPGTTISQVTDTVRGRFALEVTMAGGPRTSVEGPSPLYEVGGCTSCFEG